MQTLYPNPQRVLRRLRLVRWIALLDAVLLILLVGASLASIRDLVHILGPLHGANFLLLLTIVGTAAADGLWSWWFFLGIFLTGGPIGAFIGEWVIMRHMTSATNSLTNEQDTTI